MRKLFLLLAIAASSACTAQPVINSVDYCPVAGETSHYFYNYNDTTPVVPPLPAGAGVTWDFSWVTPFSSHTTQYLSCPGAVYCDSFPDCNLRAMTCSSSPGFADTTYWFSKSTPFAISGYGELSSGGYYSFYKSNTLRFPMHYGDFAMDTDFTRATSTSALTVNEIDTTRIDAYGTLILPAGIFTNTLRMKRTTDVSSTHYIEYTWFDAIHHGILFMFNVQYNYGTDTVSFIDYIYRDGIFPTGVQTNAAVTSFSVSPNPASAEINITYSMTNANDASLQIFDVAGRVIKQFDQLGVGDQHISVSTADMVSGMYILQLRTNSGIETTKIVVSH